MKLRLNQLSVHLQQSLASLYLITSAEPILVQEAVKKIRSAAKQQDFTEYQWLSPSTKDDWEQLIDLQQNLNLFGYKQIIEIFLPGGKSGQLGAQYLQRLAKNLNKDQIIIITTDKLDKTLLSSRWLITCEQTGVLIAIWPLSIGEMTQWLQQRAEQHQVALSTDAHNKLLELTQGNLMAAEQALQQLNLYPQPIELAQLQELVADQAQYVINDYLQQLFSKNKAHSLQLLNRLQIQDVEPIWIVWQLAQYVRNQLNTSSSSKTFWQKMLHMIYELDAVSKGNPLAEFPWPDPWSALRHFTFKVAQTS